MPVAEAYKEELLSQPPASSSGNSSGGGSGIVLLGEGDLSFAAALVAARQAAGLSCSNITATVLEQNAAELMALYPRSKVSSRLLDLIAAGKRVSVWMWVWAASMEGVKGCRGGYVVGLAVYFS